MNYNDWTAEVLSSFKSKKKIEPIISQILSLIKEYHKNLKLSGDFESFSNDFIDIFSPKLIQTILSANPDNLMDPSRVNSILTEYIRILPDFAFSGKENLLEAIYSIITKPKKMIYLEYKEGENFSIAGKDSKLYKENVSAFISSDYLKKCNIHYKECKKFDNKNDIIVANTVLLFETKWDEDLLNDFINNFGDLFIDYINQINGKQLKETKEKDVLSLISMIIDFQKDSQLSEDLSESRFDYCVRMLKLDSLSKQYSALQELMLQNKLTRKQIDTLKNEFVIDFLLQNLHKETMSGFFWMFKAMLKVDCITERNIEQLWNSCITMHSSMIDPFFRELSAVAKNLPENFLEFFWITVSKSRTLPLAAINFIDSASTTIPDSCKDAIFNRLFTGNENLQKNLTEEINRTIVNFLPKEEQKIEELQKKCISLLEENSNVSTAMCCLEKLSQTANEEDVKHMLRAIVNNATNLRSISVHLLELIHAILQRFKSPLTEEEFKIIKKCMNSSLDVAPEKLERFLMQKTVASNEVLTLGMKIEFLRSITKKKTNDTKYIHLVFSLFKFINKEKFDSSGIHTKTLDLIGMEYIWNFAKVSMSKEVAENICNIYSFSLVEDRMSIFINKCTEEPIDFSKIIVLERMMSIREGIITGRNQNRWDINDPRVKVPITGDFTGFLLLPSSLETTELLDIMSGILAYEKRNILIKIDGKTCRGKLSLSTRSIIEVKASPYSEETVFSFNKLPSYVLLKTGLYTKVLPFLSCGNREIEEMALNILNVLPTAKEVIEELKKEDPKWVIIFDKSKESQLNYYLSALGNLSLTSYANNFFINKGTEFFFNKLFYDTNFCSNILVMTITSAIMNANVSPCAEMMRADMLVNLSEEHVSFIFNELSNMLTSHPQSAVKLFSFVIKAATMNPKILRNDSFKTLFKKAVFHPELKFRQSMVKLIHLGEITPVIIVPILVLSMTPYCTQYFQLLKECAPLCSIKNWEFVINFFIEQFPSTDEFSELLVANYPPQQFVDGMIESLLAFPKETRSKQLKLCAFILNKILLNPVHLYQPTKSVFKLITELTADPEIRESLLENLSRVHTAYNETQESNIQIGQKYSGLKNLGATCYMNAALQSLFHTPSFLKSLLSADIPEDSWLFELQKLFAQMKFLPDSVISTSGFASKWLDFDGNPVNVREQQDSIEFLQTLLDRAEDVSKGITEMFQGELVNTIQGTNVEYHSASYEKFTVFPIEIENASDISKSFEIFLQPDMLTGENQYNAEGIGKIDATQSHKIKKAPKVLILQLKRFSYDLRTGKRQKIATRFDFPQDLDISSILEDTENNNSKYSLAGVIMHSGTSQSGHYTTYTKASDNQWYKFNDGYVTEYHGSFLQDSCSSNSQPTAYALIYRQQNDSDNELYNISDKVLSVLKPRLFHSLRQTVLTSDEYCEFFLSVCNDGAKLFEYFTKCLISSNGKRIIELLQNRLLVLVEGKADFANYIVTQNETNYNCLLLSSSKNMRSSYASVLCAAMQVADKSNVDQMLKYLESKFDDIMNYWRNFDEFFLPFLQSVSMSGSNERKLIPLFFNFLQSTVPEYAKKNSSFSYADINLSSVFKLLVVLLSSPKTRPSYQSVIFSSEFLDSWFQSTRHAVAFSQLLRLFVLEDNDLSSSFFRFFSENAKELSPAAAAGHFSVLISSRNEQTKNQIDWTFNFLKEKDPFYIKSFLRSLVEKICESHIDFTTPLLEHSNVWCNLWLMSDNPILRKEVKNFVISVFDAQNGDKRVDLLAELLLDKLPALAFTTLNIKNAWAVKSGKSSLEDELPASTFYEVLEWTAKKQIALQKIKEKSKLLVQMLNEHKKLNMSNNYPRNSLLNIIILIEPKDFFKHASVRVFLDAFDDLSANTSLKTAISVVNFAASASVSSVTKSVVFKSTLNALICGNKEKDSNDFDLFIRRIVTKKNAKRIAWALFTCADYKSSLKKPDCLSAELTLSFLRLFPQTSNIFMNNKCHEFAATLAIQNMDDTRILTLLREFIDSFKVTNEGKKDWLWRSKMQPIVSFLLDSKLIDSATKRLSECTNEEKEVAPYVISLLIAISMCSKQLAEKVLQSLTKYAGKLTQITPLCAQLISIVSPEAPLSSNELINKEMKVVPEQSKSMLRRALKRLSLLL